MPFIILFLKRKIYRPDNKQETDQVFGFKGFFQVPNGKKTKYHQCNDLLGNLELKAI